MPMLDGNSAFVFFLGAIRHPGKALQVEDIGLVFGAYKQAMAA